MALGRQRARQSDMLVTWAELPRSPGHVFYDKLQALLIATGFDAFVEAQCGAAYALVRGRPSLPPGRYFRMLLIGYFESIDSERGLEWRCVERCDSAWKKDPLVECAPPGGQNQAAVLTVCRAC